MTTKTRKPAAAQKQAAQERREKFRALAAKVAEMSPEQRAALVARCGAVVTIEGRPCSPVNTCLLLTQNPAASVVGGFRQWLNAGRCVKKGEKGLTLWVPLRKPESSQDSGEDSNAAAGEDGGEKSKSRFIMGAVFDISQTQEIDAEEPTDETAE